MVARLERRETRRRKGPSLLPGVRWCVRVFAETVAHPKPYSFVTGRPLFAASLAGVGRRARVKACVAFAIQEGLVTSFSPAQIKRKSRAARGKIQGLYHVTLLV